MELITSQKVTKIKTVRISRINGNIFERDRKKNVFYERFVNWAIKSKLKM